MSDEKDPTQPNHEQEETDQAPEEEEDAARDDDSYDSPVLERDAEADPGEQEGDEGEDEASDDGEGDDGDDDGEDAEEASGDEPSDEDSSDDESSADDSGAPDEEDASDDDADGDADVDEEDASGEAPDEEDTPDPTPSPTPRPVVTDTDATAEDEDGEEDGPSADTDGDEDTPQGPSDREIAAKVGAETPEAVEEVRQSGALHTDGMPINENRVAELLGDLGKIAGACGLRSLAEEVRNERLPGLAEGRITLVVLGEFNHGKSTVVNALLGDDVLPVGITPTTAVITHLVHEEEPIVRIKPPHESEMIPLDYEEMESAVKESGEEGEEPEYVEIGYPNEVLSNSLVLVDTPGVNDISRQKVEITYGYLPRADVILYVLDATQVLKKSEVTFIRDRLLKANRDRIIFVLNKVDALSPEDIAEVEQYARDRLTKLIGPVELFSFSGRESLKAQLRDGDLPSEFVRFRNYLMGFLQEQRAYIILDSALAGGARVAGLLEQNLAIKRQGYRLEADELERRIQAVRTKLKETRRLIAENTELIDERISGIAATARHNLRVFTEQFVEQLPLQIERAEASDIKRYLPSWIRDTFKNWLEEEGQEVASSLEELAEEIIEITNESLKEAVETYREEFGLTDDLDMEVDTVAYDLSVFAMGAFGVGAFLLGSVIVGSLLTLATPLLAFFLREKVDTQLKARAREEGLKAIETTSDRLEEELLRVIHEYGDRLKNFVETAGDRLYRQIEEALQQVQEETKDTDVDREQLLENVEERLERVREVGKTIQTGRSELAEWAAEVGFQRTVGTKSDEDDSE